MNIADARGPSSVTIPAVPPPRRVALSGVAETLLIPLHAKAIDYRSRHSILHDAKADEILRSLDYDFSSFKDSGRAVLLAVRARQLDEWVREFLRSYPTAIVLNLGCGLDSRVLRIDPPTTVDWYDVDFPEVIEARRAFYPDRPGYAMVGSSLNQPDWLERLPADQPVIAIADGVFEYLGESDVRQLLRRFADHFARGEVVFDVMNAYATQTGNSSLKATMQAELRWAVGDLLEVDALEPRLHRTATAPIYRSRYLPWSMRSFFWLAAFAPNLRTAIRLLRYDLVSAPKKD